MGCGVSTVQIQPSPELSWKLLPDPVSAKAKYVSDQTLNVGCSLDQLELRALLDETVAVSYIKAYAASVEKLILLDSWTEIKEMYSFLYVIVQLREKLVSICEHLCEYKHAFRDLKEKLKNLSNDSVEAIKPYVKLIQVHLLDVIFEQLFVPFKNTDMYVNMCKSLRKTYNEVCVTDFDYFEDIGEGASAIVVYCKKKSTGVFYAMSKYLFTYVKHIIIDCAPIIMLYTM